MDLDERIDAMLHLAVELEDAPIELIQQHEDAIMSAHEVLGRVYNRWLSEE